MKKYNSFILYKQLKSINHPSTKDNIDYKSWFDKLQLNEDSRKYNILFDLHKALQGDSSSSDHPPETDYDKHLPFPPEVKNSYYLYVAGDFAERFFIVDPNLTIIQYESGIKLPAKQAGLGYIIFPSYNKKKRSINSSSQFQNQILTAENIKGILIKNSKAKLQIRRRGKIYKQLRKKDIDLIINSIKKLTPQDFINLLILNS